MIGALTCALVRLCGGKHKERRVAVSVFVDNATGLPWNRECVRCGKRRLAKSRRRNAP